MAALAPGELPRSALAQDAPRGGAAPPAPELRLVPAPGRSIGFKIRAESSTTTSIGRESAGGPRASHCEMTLALEIGEADGAGALAVALRVSRITGRSTRMGFGSFDFDSEEAPAAEGLRRVAVNRFTALAGATFLLRVRTDGSVVSVSGIEEARKLATSRVGDDPMQRRLIADSISDESVEDLFLSILGPAPLPKGPVTRKTTWRDEDTLRFNSWEATYSIERALEVVSITKDAVKVAGKGSVTLDESTDVALLPLTITDPSRQSLVSEWTLSRADGLPMSGTETLAMEGSLLAAARSASTRHRCTFRVSRLESPPPPAVRPFTGAEDVARLRAKAVEEWRRLHEERRKEHERDGTRGAWGISDDGLLVAAGTPAGAVEVWRTDGTRPIVVLEGHSSLITSIAFARQGDLVYACAQDGTMRGWVVGTGKQASSIGEPYETADLAGQTVQSGYDSVATSPDGRYAAMIRFGISVWDATRRGYLDPAPSVTAPRAVLFHSDSRHALAVGYGELALYDVQATPKREPSVLDESTEWVHLEPIWERQTESRSFRLDADESSLGKGSIDDAVIVDGAGIVVVLMAPGPLDRDAKRELRGLDLRTGANRWRVPSAASGLSPARRAPWVVAEETACIRLLSPTDGKLVRTLPKPAKPPAARVFAPDGSAWFEADRDGNLVRVPVDEPRKPAPGAGEKK